MTDRRHSAALHLPRRLRRLDDARGLTAPRLSALSVVAFGGPLTLGALAAALEADGLVAREPDPRDGRGTLVRAPAAGRQLLEAGRARRTAALVAQLVALPQGDLATLARAAAIIERLARAG